MGGTFTIGTLTGVTSATPMPSETQLVYTLDPFAPAHSIEITYEVSNPGAPAACSLGHWYSDYFHHRSNRNRF